MENEIMNAVKALIIGNPFSSLIIGIVIIELGRRFIPTEKDDGFIQILGGFLKVFLDAFNVPNNVKKNDIEL